MRTVPCARCGVAIGLGPGGDVFGSVHVVGFDALAMVPAEIVCRAELCQPCAVFVAYNLADLLTATSDTGAGQSSE